MNIFLRFIFCLSTINCLATVGKDYINARHYGLGGASVTLVGLNSLDNQGTLGLVDTSSISLFFSNRYFVRELNTFAVGGVFPLKTGVLGVSVSRFGGEFYNENTFGLAYGKQLSHKFNVGMRLNYQRLQQLEYGNTGLVTAEIGALTKVSEELSFGVQIYNPFVTKLKLEDGTFIRSESSLRVGANYLLDQVKVLVEAESNNTSIFLFKTALEYQPIDFLVVRSGFVYPQKQVSVGLGVVSQFLEMDFYYQYNFLLGNSSGVSVTYAF